MATKIHNSYQPFITMISFKIINYLTLSVLTGIIGNDIRRLGNIDEKLDTESLRLCFVVTILDFILQQQADTFISLLFNLLFVIT